jgi:hypothetical protein
MLASANPNHDDDDDDFLSIDELLQQESTSASAKPDAIGMARIVDNGTRGDSPTGSNRSTVGSTQGEHNPCLNMAESSYSYDPRSDYTKWRRIYGPRA